MTDNDEWLDVPRFLRDAMQGPLFPLRSIVRHKKSGRLYLILGTPKLCKLEATATPCYLYEALYDVMSKEEPTIWARCQEEMEDGRFEHASWPRPAALPIHRPFTAALMGVADAPPPPPPPPKRIARDPTLFEPLRLAWEALGRYIVRRTSKRG